MKNETLVLPTKSITTFSSDNPRESGYIIEEPSWSFSNSVQSSAIIQGNRRDPNPWSYTVFTIKRAPRNAGLIRDTVWDEGWDPDAQRPLWRYGKNRFRYYGFAGYNLRALPELDDMNSDLYNAAISDLYERLRGSVDLSIDAFQAKKTAQMLSVVDRATNAITKTVPFGRPFKYGGRWFRNKKDVLRMPSLTPKQMGSAWLEWVYGWSPMLSTIHGIADELVNYNVNKIQRFDIKKSRKLKLVEFAAADLPIVVPFDGKCEYELQAKCRIDARYELTGHNPSKFTSLNPVSIAWELVPYSFVVDWFYDIGSYLRDFESALLYGSDFRGGYITTVYGYTAFASGATTGTFPDGSSYWDSGGAYTQRSVTFNRNLLGSSPFPIKPRLKAQLGSGRLLNAASLLSQFLRR